MSKHLFIQIISCLKICYKFLTQSSRQTFVLLLTRALEGLQDYVSSEMCNILLLRTEILSADLNRLSEHCLHNILLANLKIPM